MSSETDQDQVATGQVQERPEASELHTAGPVAGDTRGDDAGGYSPGRRVRFNTYLDAIEAARRLFYLWLSVKRNRVRLAAASLFMQWSRECQESFPRSMNVDVHDRLIKIECEAFDVITATTGVYDRSASQPPAERQVRQ